MKEQAAIFGREVTPEQIKREREILGLPPLVEGRGQGQEKWRQGKSLPGEVDGRPVPKEGQEGKPLGGSGSADPLVNKTYQDLTDEQMAEAEAEESRATKLDPDPDKNPYKDTAEDLRRLGLNLNKGA